MAQVLRNLKIIYGRLDFRLKSKLFLLYVTTFLSVVSDFLSIGSLIPVSSILIVENFGEVAGYSLISKLPLIDDENYKIYITAFFLVVLTFSTFVKLVQIFLQGRVLHGIGKNLSGLLFRQFTEYDFLSRNEIKSSLVVSLIHQRTVDFVRDVLIPGLHVPIALIYVIVASVLLTILNPLVAFASIFSFGMAYFVLGVFSSRILERAASAINKNTTNIVKLLQDYYKSSKSVIINNEHDHYIDRQSKIETAIRRSKGNVQILAAIPKPLIEFMVLFFAVVALYWYQESTEFSTNILPVIAGIVFAFQRIMPILQKGYNGYALLKGSNKVIEEIASFLNNRKPAQKSEYQNPSERPLAAIVVSSLDYSYGAKQLFSNFNLEISAGKIVRFSGSSGTGKSTLIDLISGLKYPSSGRVTFMEDQKSEYPPLVFPKIGYVGQQVGLLGGTIRENIITTNESDSLKFKKALEMSCSSEIVAQFPEGADYIVNDSSSSISGGQAQRIALARAFYSDCDILVLDEATTGIDKKTEKIIFSFMKSWLEHRIVIVVSHDDSIDIYCDKTFDIEKINA